jgi:hypothetical protein
MSWVAPEEYENTERFERELQLEKDEARRSSSIPDSQRRLSSQTA